MKLPWPSGDWRFAPEVEGEYRRQKQARLIPFARLGSLSGALAWAGYALWDPLLDPDALSRTWYFRAFMVACFAFIAALTTSRAMLENPRVWLASMMFVYTSVTVCWALLLAKLPGGFTAGLPGFILSAIFVPILSVGVGQAIGALVPLVLAPPLLIALLGGSSFDMINTAAWGLGGGGFALGLTLVIDRTDRRAFALERALEEEKRRSETLLLNVLPAEIATRLKAEEADIADDCRAATVLFADLVGFTDLARRMTAKRIVVLLNDLFSRFDRLAVAHGVEKIKTIGDAYMAAAGTLAEDPRHAERVADLALAMRDTFAEFRRANALDIGLRIGMHSGPLVAGVIGERKFIYDLWGDTVNIASRMESGGLADEIQLSDETRALLPDRYRTTPRGEIEIRGHAPRRAHLLRAA